MHTLRFASVAATLLLSCAGPRTATAPNPEPRSAPAAPPAAAAKPSAAYPPTRVQDTADAIFGQSVRDPYRWLEAVKSPEVQAWMTEEDGLARRELAKLPARAALAARLRELLYVESVTPPVHRGNRFFYSRRHGDKEKSIVYFCEGEQGAEQLLIDPNTLSPDGSIALHASVPSYDGKTLAYSLHPNNADYGTLYVMNVATRKVSAIDVIDNVRNPVSWTPKGDGFYYTYFPDLPGISVADRTGQADVRFHKLGTNPKKDVVVKDKTGDPKKFQFAQISRDGHWLVLTITRAPDSRRIFTTVTCARTAGHGSRWWWAWTPPSTLRSGRTASTSTPTMEPRTGASTGWTPAVRRARTGRRLSRKTNRQCSKKRPSSAISSRSPTCAT